jgi:hypothetical protein
MKICRVFFEIAEGNLLQINPQIIKINSSTTTGFLSRASDLIIEFSEMTIVATQSLHSPKSTNKYPCDSGHKFTY